MQNNKILILVDKIGPKKEMFAEEIGKRVGKGKQIVLARFSDLFFEIGDKKVSVEIEGMPITDFGLVYFRRAGSDFSVVASTLAVYLKYLGIRFIDTIWAEIGPLGSKFTSLVKLGLEGLPIFPTIYARGANINSYSDRIAKTLGFPFVAKEVSTQRGKGVYKINSKIDLKNLPLTDSRGEENQYMFQKFVEIDHEYRLLVLGESVRVWEEKIVTKKGEFRHNIALGAREKFLKIGEIPASLAGVAVSAAKALGLQVAGVDIATEKGTGKIFLIEVNRGPGLTYDTAVSPELPEIAKFLDRESS